MKTDVNTIKYSVATNGTNDLLNYGLTG